MRSIVITGSTRGIGFGLAREFARRGHSVLVSGRTQAAVDSAVQRIRREGSGEVIGLRADVSRFEDHEALWQAAQDAFGVVDIWLNNAGVANTTFDIADVPVDAVQTMVTTNMFGTIYGSKVATRGMLSQGHGQIFNMLGGGSDGSIRRGMGVYGATKRGLDYFTRSLTKELKDTPILVGQVRPGMVVTEGMIREAKADPDNFARFKRVMNILCDEVETVAPFLTDRMLATDRSGTEINWLTTWRVARKFMFSSFSKPRDLFSDKLVEAQEQ